MLKYFIYITAGYLLFKVVKNSITIALENIQKPKDLEGTTELQKCEQCGSFFKEITPISYNKKAFCSETCKQDHIDKRR